VSTQFDTADARSEFGVEKPVNATGGWRVVAPFRFREYRLLIAAVSLSTFAEGMWTVVMALQVIELDDDPASLSLVATCLGVGLVAFLLVGGIAADRLNQRSIIIAVEAVNVVAVSAVAVLGSLGTLEIWHIAVAAGALGVAAAFFFPAYSALLPRILPAEQLLAANGVEGVVRPVFQRAVGPAVAGVLVGATMPSVGAIAVAARRRTGTSGRHPARGQRTGARGRPGKAARAARSARRLRIRGAHSVAAVDVVVRQRVRARRARSDRGAVAVLGEEPIRRWRPDVRLPAGVLGRW
jgi:DHA3 family tetracycline resistance protein-like MFS transporter